MIEKCIRIHDKKKIPQLGGKHKLTDSKNTECTPNRINQKDHANHTIVSHLKMKDKDTVLPAASASPVGEQPSLRQRFLIRNRGPQEEVAPCFSRIKGKEPSTAKSRLGQNVFRNEGKISNFSEVAKWICHEWVSLYTMANGSSLTRKKVITEGLTFQKERRTS